MRAMELFYYPPHEFFMCHQGAHVRHPVHVDQAVQMVDLVLEDTGDESCVFLANPLAGPIGILHFDNVPAGHFAAAIRETQAALKIQILSFGVPGHFRVNQNTSEISIGPGAPDRNADDREAQGLADLRRREAHPVHPAHGEEHPFHQIPKCGGFRVISNSTRFTPRTSAVMRVDILCKRSSGMRCQSALMPSTESTARRAMIYS